MNSKNVGNIGEAKVILKFVELGIPVYIPFGDNEPADLIAEFNGKLNRIQVKTSQAKMDNGTVVFRIAKTGKKGDSNYTREYKSNEVDYFACYNLETSILVLVPFSICPKSSLSVRYIKPSTKAKNMWMSDDWTFEKAIYN
jgi:hypothetical protein